MDGPRLAGQELPWLLSSNSAKTCPVAGRHKAAGLVIYFDSPDIAKQVCRPAMT